MLKSLTINLGKGETMSYARLAGWSLLISNGLLLVATLLALILPGPLGPFGPPPVWLGWVTALVFVLLLVGLPVLYTSQRQTGWLGLAGVIVFVLATLVVGVGQNIVAAIAFSGPPEPVPSGPIVPPQAIIMSFLAGAVLFLISSVLLAAGILRVRLFPGWTAWALIASALLQLTGVFVPGAPAGVLAAILYALSTLLSAAALICIGYLLTRPALAMPIQAQRG
jgi:hypothetical protein